MQRTDLLKKTLRLGKIKGRRIGSQRMRCLDVIIDLMDIKAWELMMNSEAWHAAVPGSTKSQTWLSHWTNLNWTEPQWSLQHYLQQLEHRKVSLVDQTIRNLPAMQETQIWSLGQTDTLEKEMTTHFSILAWKIQRNLDVHWQVNGKRRCGTYTQWNITQ